MNHDPKSLDKIATGEISVTLAAELIKSTMEELTETKAQKVYTVLRAWVWKALNERRRDSELRKWHALINQTSSYLEEDYSPHAERIRVLYELVYESIAVAEVYPFAELVQRSHVKEILIYLYRSPNRSLPRQALQERLGLKEQNMSRVLTMLSTSGLLERSARGKAAVYSLTRDGAKHAGSIDYVDITSDKVDPHALQYGGDMSPLRKGHRIRHWKIAMASGPSTPPRRAAEQIKLRVQRREKADARQQTNQARRREKSYE
ncbi:hypothetical protein MUU53_20240 [Rhizobium lemnae]|uniref:HTH marR-type domain-containing protein n=1 Tax=Rhizobium lemnae TaxID=1214924 RepID=A0ABV8E7B1_9HYPH|nr:hypothetical protein [Rhizobium lemnae]MCJ8510219.1 hypothetical protein [Rhizobium lemnae]